MNRQHWLHSKIPFLSTTGHRNSICCHTLARHPHLQEIAVSYVSCRCFLGFGRSDYHSLHFGHSDFDCFDYCCYFVHHSDCSRHRSRYPCRHFGRCHSLYSKRSAHLHHHSNFGYFAAVDWFLEDNLGQLHSRSRNNHHRSSPRHHQY